MEQDSRDPRSNGFDLLRLGFASLVLLSHAAEYEDGNRSRELLTPLFCTISSGELAVDAFFLLSGFLIIQSWQRNPSVGPFLLKRTMRIYPAFIVASLICVVAVGGFAVRYPADYYAHLNPVQTLANLIYLLPPDGPHVFVGEPYPDLDGAVWTIHYEALCYLAVATLGLFGLIRRRERVAILWILAMSVFLLHRLGRADGLSVAVFYDTPASLVRFAMLFLSGAIFACYPSLLHWSPRAGILATMVLLAGLCSPLFAEPALATAGAYLLLAGGKRLRLPIAMPDISYGTYLYGTPIQKLIIFWLPPLHPLAAFALALPIALVLGAASWIWIEKPMLDCHARWRSSRSTSRHDARLFTT